MSKADELKSSLEQVRRDAVSVKSEPKAEVEVAATPQPAKTLKETSADEIAESLSGPEIDVSIEDLINGACS